MKKYFIPFLVLGTTLLYSCAKEEVTSDTDSSSSVEKVIQVLKKLEWNLEQALMLCRVLF